MGEAKEIKLIDFLYRDLARIESLYAQLFKGSVQEINRSISRSAEKASQYSGSIKVVQGGIQNKDNVTNATQEKLDPHDQRIIDILDEIDLPCQEKLDGVFSGDIALIKGAIAIRDYSTFKQFANIIVKEKAIKELFTIKEQE